MIAVNDATVAMGAAPACHALGLSRATLYRGRHPVEAVAPRPTPPRALNPVERQEVLISSTCASSIRRPRRSMPRCSMKARISVRRVTMRSWTRAHEIKERRNQVRRPHYAAPELLATRPNEVWSWDITKLLGPAKWTSFFIYVILDIFSR